LEKDAFSKWNELFIVSTMHDKHSHVGTIKAQWPDLPNATQVGLGLQGISNLVFNGHGFTRADGQPSPSPPDLSTELKNPV